MPRPRRAATALLALLLLADVPTDLRACTGITVRPRDGSIIFARTLEFAVEIRSDLIAIPRGREFVGSAPGGGAGLRWRTRFGAVGMNAFGRPLLADGLNEKGLHVGVFYFPGYAGYQDVRPEERGRALAPHELAGFLLGTCADAGEAVAAAKGVRVGEAVLEEFGSVPPFHFIVNDASGTSVVLEHVAGELKVHPNPLGVMSNAPTFDWHMTNLRNYVNLSAGDPPGAWAKGFGQGSGMLGLPGDFTPPSRFVRAVAFSKTALPVGTAREGVLQAFHLLNPFDIPKGAARSLDGGKPVADYTLWTSAADLTNRRYHVRTYDNSRVRMIDLSAVDFDAEGVATIPLRGGERVEDVTPAAGR